jgi:hypothetical protein
MLMRRLVAISILGLVSCGGEDERCAAGRRQCDGSDAIKECIGGEWQAPQPCSAVCQSRSMVSIGCTPDATGSADCSCAPLCQEGETRCEGLSLKTCRGSQWEVSSCDTLCKQAGFVKATACAFDAAKGAEACTCESPSGWGESCSATQVCPTGFVCVAYGGKSFCTQNCTTAGTKCSGTPAGTYAACLIKMSDGTRACAFVCKSKTGTFTCPGAMTCSSTEDPPASGQYPCLP